MLKHVLYVPSQHEEDAREIALTRAGGCTLSAGHRGYWQGPYGVVHEDAITLVTVFEDGSDARDAVVKLLFDRGEQAVAYETNGVPHLIDAPREG